MAQVRVVARVDYLRSQPTKILGTLAVLGLSGSMARLMLGAAMVEAYTHLQVNCQETVYLILDLVVRLRVGRLWRSMVLRVS
jgi:predicted metal-dependent peptidase